MVREGGRALCMVVMVGVFNSLFIQNLISAPFAWQVCGEDLGMIPACVKGVLEGVIHPPSLSLFVPRVAGYRTPLVHICPGGKPATSASSFPPLPGAPCPPVCTRRRRKSGRSWYESATPKRVNRLSQPLHMEQHTYYLFGLALSI